MSITGACWRAKRPAGGSGANMQTALWILFKGLVCSFYQLLLLFTELEQFAFVCLVLILVLVVTRSSLFMISLDACATVALCLKVQSLSLSLSLGEFSVLRTLFFTLSGDLVSLFYSGDDSLLLPFQRLSFVLTLSLSSDHSRHALPV